MTRCSLIADPIRAAITTLATGRAGEERGSTRQIAPNLKAWPYPRLYPNLCHVQL